MASKPIFNKAVTDSISALGIADIDARAAGSNASQARGVRSSAATDLILTTHKHVEGFQHGADIVTQQTAEENLRDSLLAAGVLKGTVSKIMSVLVNLRAEFISPSDVVSLNAAYSLIKKRQEKIAEDLLAAARAAAPEVPVGPQPEILTEDSATAFFIRQVQGSEDPRAKAGELLTRFTDALIKAAAEMDDEDADDTGAL